MSREAEGMRSEGGNLRARHLRDNRSESTGSAYKIIWHLGAPERHCESHCSGMCCIEYLMVMEPSIDGEVSVLFRIV